MRLLPVLLLSACWVSALPADAAEGKGGGGRWTYAVGVGVISDGSGSTWVNSKDALAEPLAVALKDSFHGEFALGYDVSSLVFIQGHLGASGLDVESEGGTDGGAHRIAQGELWTLRVSLLLDGRGPHPKPFHTQESPRRYRWLVGLFAEHGRAEGLEVDRAGAALAGIESIEAGSSTYWGIEGAFQRKIKRSRWELWGSATVPLGGSGSIVSITTSPESPYFGLGKSFGAYTFLLGALYRR